MADISPGSEVLATLNRLPETSLLEIWLSWANGDDIGFLKVSAHLAVGTVQSMICSRSMSKNGGE